MPGFSITLLLLPSKNDESAPSTDLLLSLLDDQCEAPGWKWSSRSPAPSLQSIKTAIRSSASQESRKSTTRILKTSDPALFTERIKKACNALITAEPEITRMDTIAGDGDLLNAPYF